MNRKAQMKKATYKTPLPGARIWFWGALLMFAWAVWECALRIDAMDGVTQAYFKLARQNDIPLLEALANLWNTPSARQDVLNPLVLAFIALFAALSLCFHRRWTPGFAVIPLCACVAAYPTSGLALVRALNLFETAKFLSAAAVALGAGTNIACALSRRARARKALLTGKREAAENARTRLPHGTRKTLVPPRTHPRPGIGM